MPFYTGPAFTDGVVCLAAPDVARILQSTIAADVLGDVEHYLASAPHSATEIYFCIYENDAPVGQIVLHDINESSGESLIGYCLFRPDLRGRGIGTRALRLLQHYVVEQTTLSRLVIITSTDNLASQAIARKCGFQFDGGAWEDPEHLVVFVWTVPRTDT